RSRAERLSFSGSGLGASATAYPRDVHADLVQLDARVQLRRVLDPVTHRFGDDRDVHPVGDHYVNVDIGAQAVIGPRKHDAFVDLPRAEDAPYALGEAGRGHTDDAGH